MEKKITGLGGLPQGNFFEALPDFTRAVHVRENKPENEDHLNANRQKFTGQCAIVLSLLQKGIVLTSFDAMTKHSIGHLARRIKDIKDELLATGNFNIIIEDQLQYDATGKITRNKIWFIRECLSEKTIMKYKIEHKSPGTIVKELKSKSNARSKGGKKG